MEDRYHHLQRRKKKKKRRRRLVTFLILASIFGCLGLYMLNSYSSLMKMYSGFTRNKSELRVEEVEITKEPFSVLIMGIEDYATDGQNGRTDSLMVATVNPKTKHISLMSIPRDSRVYIVGKDKTDKINAAHAYGGEKMAVETVENFLHVPIDHYIKIDFKGFKGIVDAVGGITVDVPFDFWERSDTDYNKKIYFKQGKQELNGEEALAYVRMRKQDPQGDHGRAERQRQVLAAVAEKLNSTSTVFKVKDLADVIGNYVKTDIPVSDGIALYQKFADFDPANIETVTLEGEDQKINNIYYFIPDEASLQAARQTLLQNLEQETSDQTKNTADSSHQQSKNTSEEWKMK